MRRLVLLAVLISTASCSDAGFQIGSGVPDTDYNVTEASSDGGGEDAAEPDSGEEDAEPIDDSSVIDSGSSDTTIIPDMGGPIDTGAPDTFKPDTGFDTKPDSTAPDTGFDTGIDTGSDTGFDSGFDSGIRDSGLDIGADTRTDTGSDTSVGDSGPTCPAPPSTAMPPSLEGLSCSDLDTKYKAMVQEARRCNCDADCSKEVARDFCGCTLYVNPGNDATNALTPIMDRYSKLTCAPPPCPLGLCIAGVAGKCVASGTGGTKICADGSIVTVP